MGNPYLDHLRNSWPAWVRPVGRGAPYEKLAEQGLAETTVDERGLTLYRYNAGIRPAGET